MNTRIMAVAGSGKTTTAANIGNEIGQDSNVLYLSFSKESASQLSSKLLHDQTCSTIHSFCLRLVKEFSLVSSPLSNYDLDIVLPQNHASIIMSDVCYKHGISYSDFSSFITSYVNSSIAPDSKYLRAYNEYQSEKESLGKIDFNDMLILVNRLLDDDDALDYLSNRYDCIVIDEMQDLSLLQVEILSKLALGPGRPKVIGIGDPYQSIYQWRSAFPRVMFDFATYFGDYDDIKLDKSWRCPEKVCALANRIRPEVSMVSNGDTGMSRLSSYDTEVDEYVAVAESIYNKIVMGVHPSDIAVLTRTNNLCGVISYILHSRGVPYRLLGGRNSYFDLREVNDMLSYVRLSVGDSTRDYKRILNRPTRYLDDAWFVSWSSRGCKLKDIPYNGDQLERDIRAIRDIEYSNVGELITGIRNVLGYDEWVRENTNYNIYSYSSDNLDSLVKIASNYNNIDVFLRFVNSVKNSKPSRDSVIVSTIHKYKGKESPIVYLPMWRAGIMPHSKTVSMSEELNLAYVGITRASEEVYISCSGVPGLFYSALRRD